MPDTVTLPNIAEQLGLALGVGAFGGQVLMGFIFMMIFLIPTLYLCNKSNMNPTFPSFIVGIGTLAAAVPLFHFPSWIVITIFLLIALMGAGKLRDWIGSRGD